jgi:hypothetical protein
MASPIRTQTLQASGHKQLPEGIGESAEKGEEGKPDNRNLQDAGASESVRQ